MHARMDTASGVYINVMEKRTVLMVPTRQKKAAEGTVLKASSGALVDSVYLHTLNVMD